MTSNYQAKFFAYALTREGGKGVERLQQSLLNAAVDLNPHQVEAALFALRSPISKGALLSDEVGLGKTIEAGPVMCQLWAERKRKILVVCPASLRKPWQRELEDKFNKGYVTVEGTSPKGEKALVVWRDVEKIDNAALKSVIEGAVKGFNVTMIRQENDARRSCIRQENEVENCMLYAVYDKIYII